MIHCDMLLNGWILLECLLFAHRPHQSARACSRPAQQPAHTLTAPRSSPLPWRPAMRSLLLLSAFLCGQNALAGDRPAFHLWLEPEWFEGVKGSFAYWTGTMKPHGAWGIAGPGISAEW